MRNGSGPVQSLSEGISESDDFTFIHLGSNIHVTQHTERMIRAEIDH